MKLFPKNESSWKYNGPFSYVSEWHMATIGFSVGFILAGSKTIRKELSKEPQYFLGSLVIGIVLRVIYE